MRGTTLVAILLLSCGSLTAENLEKTQKKELESQAKAIIAEAKSMEKSGQLAEARTKYIESQAMIEMKDAESAIKHLDEEIHKRIKDALNQSHKLYDAHKYKEAALALEEGAKLGSFEGVLSSNLALCYYQLGDRDKAVENLDKAISDTPDPKKKQKLQELMTFLTTGENGNAAPEDETKQIAQFNRLAELAGFDASLEDEQGAEEETSFSEADLPSLQMVSEKVTAAPPAPHASHSVVTPKSSMCTALEGLKGNAATGAAAVYDRANCAEINGRPTEAIRLLQKYLDIAPQARDAEVVRVRIAELQSLGTLHGQKAGEVRRHYASAYGYLAERKYDRALAAFLKAKELAPDFQLTYWKLGLLYEAMGNVDLARENFTHCEQLSSDDDVKSEINAHLTALDAKKSTYDDEVAEAEDIFGDLFNRGMNLTFNLDNNRSAIRARRARIKKKEDQKKDRNRVGGFAVPYPYAQQELARAAEHLQLALGLFPLGAEANELMALFFLQANDGRAAIKNFDAVASQGLPPSFYAEMHGRKFDQAVKCELSHDRVHLVYLSSYDKKGNPTAPGKPAGEDGLGDLTLVPGGKRQEHDSLDLRLSEIKSVKTDKGLLTVKLEKQEFRLAPIYLTSYTPVEGPPARRFANNYTRLFVRYPGLEDSKLGAEGMTGGEKVKMGFAIANDSLNIATSLNPIGAIQATMSTISIARTIHSAMASLKISFASWERTVDDQQQLLSGPSFKTIPTGPVNLAFAQELK